jgi:MoaA/NifB/PqqE/SkfB family radical SAM enzyme
MFEKVLSRLVAIGVKAVILTGGGEPCINPDFDGIIKCLDDSGIDYGINSNFLMYRDCDPVYLKVSLDAWDEESYKQARGVNGYSSVRNNIIKFKERHHGTSLGIQQIGTDTERIIRFYDANKDLPVDYIVIRPMESTNGIYYTNCCENVEDIISCISELKQKDNRVTINYKYNHIGQKFDRCVSHWAQIAVNESGDVMYCCHKPKDIIGSIFDSDIMDKHKKAITDMRTCDVPCRMTAPNSFYNVPRDVNFI